MSGLVLACAGIVLACVGMFGNVQSCARLFYHLGSIQIHPVGVLQWVELALPVLGAKRRNPATR